MLSTTEFYAVQMVGFGRIYTFPKKYAVHNRILRGSNRYVMAEFTLSQKSMLSATEFYAVQIGRIWLNLHFPKKVCCPQTEFYAVQIGMLWLN